MGKSICLIRLPSPFLIEDHLFPPLGLMAVGTGLKMQGYDVHIHDGPIDEIPQNYDWYGVGPTIVEYADALKIKNKPLIIGGPFATIRPEQCYRDGFDKVVIGDGEVITKDAIEREGIFREARELPLEQYPIIDRSLVDIKSYKYFIDDVLATTIMTGRGCPFRCGFCSKNHSSVRLQNAERIIEEIDYLHFEYGYKALAFPEDLFILDKNRATTVFRHMAKRGILSRCLVRADVVVKHGQDFANFMADCGCHHVGMGVESGSDIILKNVHKGETSEIMKSAIKMLRSANIKVKGFFIVGLPGESETTLSETRQFLDEMNLYDVDIKVFQPYPGSPIWEHKKEYDIDWDKQNYGSMFYKGRPGEYFGTVRTSNLTTQEIYDHWVDMEQTYKKWA